MGWGQERALLRQPSFVPMSGAAVDTVVNRKRYIKAAELIIYGRGWRLLDLSIW